MEIVANIRSKEMPVETGAVYTGKRPDDQREYLMVIEDRSGARSFERYALLNLANGALRSGWTNDNTIRKLLADGNCAHCPDAALHLTVDAEE